MGVKQMSGAQRSANLVRLFRPRSVAVVGASANAEKAGYQALKALRSFDGEVWPINPGGGEILGRKVYKDVREIGRPADLAILAVPPQACVQAFADVAEAGCGGAAIVSGGFAESGPEGVARQDALSRIVTNSATRLLGPNTSGFINPSAACRASFVPGLEKVRPGNIAVVAQSGGVNLTLTFQLHNMGLGVSLAVGLGNAVDVGAVDLLDYLATDATTSAIVMHLEGVENGRALYETLRRVTPIKPVVVVAAGRSDVAEFAQSHTGKILGPFERKSAMLKQAGAVVAASTEEASDIAAALSMRRLRPAAAPRVAVVTGQAGPGLLIADTLNEASAQLASFAEETRQALARLLPPMTYLGNPVDTGRPGPSFPDVLRTVTSDPSVAATLVFALHEPAALDPSTIGPAGGGAAVVFGTLGDEEDVSQVRAAMAADKVPCFFSPERTARATVALLADAKAQHRIAAAQDESVAAAQPLSGSFDEERAKALLAQYGIAIPRSQACHGRQEAHEFLRGADAPVVVKLLSREVAHKTEVGGVILNVATAEQLDKALDRIDAIPISGRRGYLVEETAPQGIEMIVGGLRDASFGPLVLLGFGGVQAEALKDSATRLVPLGDRDVDEMIDELRTKALLEGFRHTPPVDKARIYKIVRAVARILAEHPEIQEIEINPFRIAPDAELALDAFVRI